MLVWHDMLICQYTTRDIISTRSTNWMLRHLETWYIFFHFSFVPVYSCEPCAVFSLHLWSDSGRVKFKILAFFLFFFSYPFWGFSFFISLFLLFFALISINFLTLWYGTYVIDRNMYLAIIPMRFSHYYLNFFNSICLLCLRRGRNHHQRSISNSSRSGIFMFFFFFRIMYVGQVTFR